MGQFTTWKLHHLDCTSLGARQQWEGSVHFSASKNLEARKVHSDDPFYTESKIH